MKFARKMYVAAFMFALPLLAGAQATTNNNAPGVTGNSLVGFQNPLSQDSICGALKLFLQVLFILGIPIAVLFLVYAGFLFVWARGSKDELVHAKRNLMYVIIGIGLFIGAWTLGQIIANTLGGLASATGTANSQLGSCR